MNNIKHVLHLGVICPTPYIKIRISYLDSLRGIAILLVVLFSYVPIDIMKIQVINYLINFSKNGMLKRLTLIKLPQVM